MFQQKCFLFPKPLLGNDSANVDKENPGSVVDEVLWVVGDEPILKSDLEIMRLQSEADGKKWKKNPNCEILEQLAVQKLFFASSSIR